MNDSPLRWGAPSQEAKDMLRRAFYPTPHVPVIFFETDRNLTQAEADRLREEWNLLFNGSCKACILPPGVHSPDRHTYEPSGVSAKVGNLAIECGPNIFGGDFTIDGEPIKPFTKMVLTMDVGKQATVQIDYPVMPSKTKDL